MWVNGHRDKQTKRPTNGWKRGRASIKAERQADIINKKIQDRSLKKMGPMAGNPFGYGKYSDSDGIKAVDRPS